MITCEQKQQVNLQIEQTEVFSNIWAGGGGAEYAARSPLLLRHALRSPYHISDLNYAILPALLQTRISDKGVEPHPISERNGQNLYLFQREAL